MRAVHVPPISKLGVRKEVRAVSLELELEYAQTIVGSMYRALRRLMKAHADAETIKIQRGWVRFWIGEVRWLESRKEAQRVSEKVQSQSDGGAAGRRRFRGRGNRCAGRPDEHVYRQVGHRREGTGQERVSGSGAHRGGAAGGAERAAGVRAAAKRR